MEVKGLKITGWKKAVSESGNYGGTLFNNVYCNFKTGKVWLKEETQNSWTVYQNPDVMQVLSSPYKLTVKQLEAAIEDKMDILENIKSTQDYTATAWNEHTGRNIIMKKYTAKEIAEYLADSGTAFEWEGEEARYYLHYRAGQLVNSLDHADFTTWARDKYLEDLWAKLLKEAQEEYDDDEYAAEKASEKFDQIAWTTETADSKELLEVAQELAAELNAYIEEEEEDC